MIQVPEVTVSFCDTLQKVARQQLRQSKMYKQPRMAQIKESEDLYNGVVKRSLARESTEPFPFMSGFVDHLYSEIDEAPDVDFSDQDEADYKYAKKVSAFFSNEKDSILPHSKWALKDRWVKKMAIFSGRGIFKYYASSDPVYRSNLDVIDHYDFHSEPGGGGHLESHLFCGQEGIFKTKEDLLDGAKENWYDMTQVGKLLTNSGNRTYKENADDYGNTANRHRGLGLDPESNNYTGQQVYKLVEWYLTYQGIRWYILFDDQSSTWIRVKALRDVFPILQSTGDALWPFVTWATHEDPKVFWSKAPCDDARPIAKQVNKLINQEIYNREKKNKGTRFYDPTMIEDVEALTDERADSLIPVNTRNGKRSLDRAIHRVEHGEISGTIDLVQFLDSYHGQKSGSTPGSQGDAEKDKKVGIFFGELQQVQKRLGVYNKSYREAWAELGLRFIMGLEDHLNVEQAIKIVGSSGIEWDTLNKSDLAHNRPLEIKVKGGQEESKKNEILAAKKSQALAAVQTVNPQWKDRQMLKNANFSDDEIKEAFSTLDGSNQELMSEAAQAIEDIENGKNPRLNRGANAAFMQKIVDYSIDLNMKDAAKEEDLANRLLDYALKHTMIAAENENRSVIERIKNATGAPMIPGADANATGAMRNAAINGAAPKPEGSVLNASGTPNLPGGPAAAIAKIAA